MIMGTVTGNIHCTDRLDIRSEGSLTGDVVTPRICVEDGAVLKGAVEVRAEQQEKTQKTTEAAKAAAAGSGPSVAQGSKATYNESN